MNTKECPRGPLEPVVGRPDDVVGHKTFHSPERGYWHEPITRAEADDLWAGIEAEKARRLALIPDEAAALRLFFDAWLRLKELGWAEAMYCPKNGKPFLAIEAGSTGQHACRYDGEWPTGSYWIADGGDEWPANPVLWKPLNAALSRPASADDPVKHEPSAGSA